MRAIHLTITGRVQGVGYRWWAVGEARRLGLRGYVRNRRDGSVEAVAAGPAEAVARFADACRHGPPAAFVEAASVSDIAPPPDLPAGFEQWRTV